MSHDIYDDAHVTICRLLDRRHNNPLGDTAWPLLQCLLHTVHPRVLDIGCGRGASSIDWAQRGAVVVGLDPSAAMIAEANRNRDAVGPGLDATFQRGCLDTWQPPGGFDLVLLHDVVCYLPDRAATLAAALSLGTPGGLLSVTDYHGEPGIPAVDSVTLAWGIDRPVPFDRFRGTFESTGARVLMCMDTTRQYRAHWTGLLGRMRERRTALVAHVGLPAVDAFEQQIQAILEAVGSGRFGHLWAILAVPG